MRPVHFSEGICCGGIERGDYEVGGEESLPRRFSGKEGAVRQDGNGDIRRLFNLPDHVSDLFIQGGLSGPGKSDIIDLTALSDRFFNLRENPLDGVKCPPGLSFLGCPPQLAVNTVKRAGLKGDDIDAERKPEAPGRNGAVDVREQPSLLGRGSFRAF